MDLLNQITTFINTLITVINVPLNALGRLLNGPIAALPGWLSNTLFAVILGILCLVLFKYTSNQSAIGRVRDTIKANMLALKLYKNSLPVTFMIQGRIFRAAFMLLVHSLRPLAVMIIPVSLLLTQLSLWYQAAPLQPGEDAVVIVQLNGQGDSPLPDVAISSMPNATIDVGPFPVPYNRQICWKIRADKPGTEPIIFKIGSKEYQKELAVGDNFTRVSIKRPAAKDADAIMHPAEKPFPPESVVQSISIEYLDRPSKICGTDWWVIYLFAVSMIAALVFKPIFKVKI